MRNLIFSEKIKGCVFCANHTAITRILPVLKMKVLQFLSIIVVITSVLIGLLASGVLSKLGLFRFVASLYPTLLVGAIPSTLSDEFKASAFSFNDIPNLKGHVALVTGANVSTWLWYYFYTAFVVSHITVTCRLD